MRSLEQAEVAGYIAAAEWSDAAGGYRIQERGGMLVEWIRGSYSNVVGLPMEGLYVILRRNGYRFW
jgi:septum formation protein